MFFTTIFYKSFFTNKFLQIIFYKSFLKKNYYLPRSMNSKQFNETISQEMEQTSNDNGTRSFLADILDTNNPENIAAANFRIFIGILGCFLALLFLYLSCVNSSNQEDSSASVSVISLIFYTFFLLAAL